MTVPVQTPFISHTASGSTATFAFDFLVIQKTDLQVTVGGGALLQSDFSITGLGEDNGGTITLVAGNPVAGTVVILQRSIPLSRDFDYQQSGEFRSVTVNADFDRIWQALQDGRIGTRGAIRYPATENLDGTLVGATTRASQLLGFDVNGYQALYPVTASVGAGDMRVDSFTGGVDFTAGVTTQLTLSRPPGNPANLEIFFDPLYQGPDQWSLAGSVVTFTAPIPVGVSKVFARIGTTLSTAIPPDGSVGDAQLAWGTSLARVVSSRAELKSLDTNKYKRALVIGYASAGDRGGLGAVYFAPASVAADNGGSVTAPTVGNGRWLMQNPDVLNPFMFGAKGDKVTDDTAAIQACYDAVPNGGTLYIPRAPGDAYIISKQAAVSYCLNFSRMVHIRAEGFFSALQPVGGTTVNTVLLKPDPALAYWGMKWEGLTLGDPYTGNRAGNNGLFIDTQIDGSQLPAAIFRNLNVMTPTVVGGVGILHVNVPAGLNINGGMYGTSFEDCIVRGGFSLQASGDSNVIKRALISGPNVGVYFGLTVGASLLTLEDCNITSTGGAILADAGSRFKMYHCNCEQIQPFTQSISGFTTDCMVYLRGNSGTISTPEIVGNHFGLFSAVPNACVVRINNVVGGKADGNVLLNSNAAPTGFIVTSSTNFRIGDGNTYGTSIVTTGSKVVDSGTGTMGVYKPLASTLINAWSQSPSAPTSTFVSFKNCAGLVVVDGKLSGGTVTSGTAFATLPQGHRPLETREFPVVTYNGATLTPGHIRVETDGTMRFMAGQNTELHLSSIRFMAADLADATSDL